MHSFVAKSIMGDYEQYFCSLPGNHLQRRVNLFVRLISWKRLRSTWVESAVMIVETSPPCRRTDCLGTVDLGWKLKAKSL